MGAQTPVVAEFDEYESGAAESEAESDEAGSESGDNDT